MSQANVLSAAAIGFVVGALTGSFVSVPFLLLAGLALLLSLVLLALFRTERARIALVAALFVLIGAGAYQQAASVILEAAYPLAQQHLSFEAKVVEQPDVRPEKTFVVLESLQGPPRGRVRATVHGDNLVFGEFVQVEGLLEQPENFDGFDYRGWLAKEGIGYVMHEPRITPTGRYEQGVRSLLAQGNNHLRSGIERMLPPPHSSLYRAMVLGQRGALTADEQEVLRGAGLSHIVAISGMHISILFSIVLAVLLGVGLGRAAASYVALALMASYIVMIGAPPSAVRAGLMAATLIGAERVGRPNSSWRVLLLVAALMVAANPLIVRHDVGFQLSFVAVGGILAGLPHRDRLLFFIPESAGLRSLLAMTLSAQAATLPLVLLHFGTAPVWGVLANILVVPVLPLVLVLGMMSAGLGILGAPLLAATPAWMFSSYIFFIAGLFA